MNIEISKSPIPTNAHDTRRGRTKYPFDELPVVDPKSTKPQPCMTIEGERNVQLVQIRMRAWARDNKARFMVDKEAGPDGKPVKLRIWRVE